MLKTEIEKRATKLSSRKKYNQSDKGKANRKRYSQTDKGKATRRCYRRSDQYKVSQERYRQSGKGKDGRLKHLYNLSLEDYNKLVEKQNGKCAICNKEFNMEDLCGIHVDHDHITGKVRSLLCRKCNAMLGFSDDTISKLESAISYLKSFQEIRI